MSSMWFVKVQDVDGVIRYVFSARNRTFTSELEKAAHYKSEAAAEQTAKNMFKSGILKTWVCEVKLEVSTSREVLPDLPTGFILGCKSVLLDMSLWRLPLIDANCDELLQDWMFYNGNVNPLGQSVISTNVHTYFSYLGTATSFDSAEEAKKAFRDVFSIMADTITKQINAEKAYVAYDEKHVARLNKRLDAIADVKGSICKVISEQGDFEVLEEFGF